MSMKRSVLATTAAVCALMAGERASQAVPAARVSQAAPTEQMSVSDAFAAVGATANLSARVTEGSAETPLSGVSVTFTVDGASAGQALTNAEGVASLPFVVDASKGVTARTITASAWTRARVGASGHGTIHVFKSAVNVGFAPGSAESAAGARAGAQVYVQGTLTRITDNAGLDGRSVDCRINGNTVSHVFTQSGNYNCTYTIPANVPKVAFQVGFDGDDVYLPGQGSLPVQSIAQPLRPVYLWAREANGNTATVRPGDTVTLTADVTSTAGQFWPTAPGEHGVGGVQVYVGLSAYGVGTDGWPPCGQTASLQAPELGTVTLTTDANGVARGTLKMPDCIPTQTALYITLGDGTTGYFAAAQSGMYLTIAPTTTTMTLAGPSSGHVGDTLHFLGKVVRGSDGKQLTNVGVSGRLSNGAQVNGGTDGAGVLHVDVPLTASMNAGANTVTFTFLGTTGEVEPSHATIQFNVLPATN
jgi:hypothetical protein